MKHIQKLILIHLSGFLLISFQVNSQTNNATMLEKKLDAALATYFQKDQPGGSVLIQKGNDVLYSRSFGLADMKTKEPFTSNTISNTGSISKTFVSYGILLLEAEKKLSLDDNLLKYFPEFKNKKIGEQITIRHLLTHTSGLPDSRKVDEDSIFYLTADDAQNWAPLLETDSLRFPVGSKYEYSNPAYNGLAMIIEKVSGMGWRDYLQKKIFDPSGMKDTKITDGAYPDKDVAHGYRKVNGQWQEYDYGEVPTFCAAGNGGVWCSVNDLAKYLLAIKNATFAKSSLLESSKNPWKPSTWAMPYEPYKGYAWFAHTGYNFSPNSKDKDIVIEHSGSQGGFRAHFLFVPQKNISVIWLTNNDLLITKPIWNVLKEEKIVE